MIGAAGLAVAAVLGASSAAAADPAGLADRPLIIGHRGAAGLAPENTLPAFAAALQTGVDKVELDVRYTKDHVLVVYHDGTLRHAQCLGPYVGMRVATLTYAQLEADDCGYPSKDGARQVLGTPIATLAQVFDLLDANGDRHTEVQIEVKDAPADRSGTIAEFLDDIAAVVQAHEPAGRVSVSSQEWDVLRAAAADPRFAGIPLVAIGSAASLGLGVPGVAPKPGVDINAAPYNGDVAAAAKDAGATWLALNHADFYVTPQFITHAHDLGLKVGLWSVDDAATMSQLIATGVDAVTTNYPDVLRAAEQGEGWTLPTADTLTQQPARVGVPRWMPVPRAIVSTTGAATHALYARRTGERYYRKLGGRLTGPAAVVAAHGRDYFIGVGAHRRLYVRTYTTGWSRLSGTHVACSQPAATVVGSSLAVACTGYNDHRLHYATAPLRRTGNPVLRAWRSLGGTLHSGPAVYLSGGSVHITAVASVAGSLYDRTPRAGWRRVGMTCGAQPDVQRSGALTYIACRDRGGHLEYRTNGTVRRTTIPAVGRVGLAAGGSDRVVAYVQGGAGSHVWVSTLNYRFATHPISYDGRVGGGVAATTY